MKTYLRDQIDWEQPFPPEEYAERRAKVRAFSDWLLEEAAQETMLRS